MKGNRGSNTPDLLGELVLLEDLLAVRQFVFLVISQWIHMAVPGNQTVVSCEDDKTTVTAFALLAALRL